jgi:hypothetical protein
MSQVKATFIVPWISDPVNEPDGISARGMYCSKCAELEYSEMKGMGILVGRPIQISTASGFCNGWKSLNLDGASRVCPSKG